LQEKNADTLNFVQDLSHFSRSTCTRGLLVLARGFSIS
jgi:hypothetical protein